MEEKKEVGLIGLITIVLGSMIGGGIYNMPKEIALTTSVGAALIGWLISGVGVFFIGRTFQILSMERSKLINGIYSYAKAGFGRYAGFNSAWGYWVGNVLGNAAYAVITVNTLTYFFPKLGGDSSAYGVILGTILIWGIIVIVNLGMTRFNLINLIATIAKIIPIAFAIIVMWIGLNYDLFISDFWGQQMGVGSIIQQVKGCMLQTLWAFIGIEGAVVLSGRAKNCKDIPVATITGYIVSLFLYVLIVILSYGIMPAQSLGKLHDPALSYILEAVIGKIGATIINIGVLISVFGAWISWTLLTAEIPYTVASKDRLFPEFLAKTNEKGAALGALLVNGVIKQIAFVLSIFTGNAWLAITNAATSMLLIPYVFSCMYLVKLSYKHKHKLNMFCGIMGVIYGIWMLYAQGIEYILQSGAIYSLGIIFLIRSSYETKTKIFNSKYEILAGIIVTALGIGGFYSLINSMG